VTDEPDGTFRTLMLIGLLILLPIGLFHRLKSQATGERLDRSQEGMFMLATLRPVGFLHWAGVIAYLISPAWMAWSSVPLPLWLRWTGAALMPIGAGLVVWTFRALGPNLTDTVVTRQSHTLVTRGPYRFIRHPLYDAVAVLAMSMSLQMANWFMLATGAAGVILLAIRSRTEEDRLLARFGESYRAYRSQTGRFLPKIARR
jgi:protein-S-isoprenylcysteine O-methyltransferase Ste14